MDLKQFVTAALTDVLEGVKDAKEKYRDQIEPAQSSGGLGGGTVQRSVTVSFDLNVREGGTQGKRVTLDSNNTGSNRLKFDIHVTF